jgi:hypothetical protein
VLFECWLNTTDVRMLAVPQGNVDYARLLQAHPGWFTSLGHMDDTGWDVYGVEAPRPDAATCAEASRSATG